MSFLHIWAAKHLFFISVVSFLQPAHLGEYHKHEEGDEIILELIPKCVCYALHEAFHVNPLIFYFIFS